MNTYIGYIVSILSGLAVCIPLVIKLVQYVSQAVKERNWSKLMELVAKYMTEAEKKLGDGASRKEWVMAMVEQSAKSIGYPFDDVTRTAVSQLVDSLCDMAKTVNTPAT